MKLGTVVYDGKIYNLDYMTAEEMMNLLKKIEDDKNSTFNAAKEIVNS